MPIEKAKKHFLGKEGHERLDCAQAILNLAGSLKCDEIRKLKKLSCLGCVEKAAEFLHSSTYSAPTPEP
jgi:hypothetical protein